MSNKWTKVETVPTWDFQSEYEEAGNKPIEFVGLYVSREENVGPNNSNLYTFEIAGGEHKAIWGTTLLDTRFKNLKFGEEVKVVYLGKVKSEQRKGAEYHNFEVYHRMPDFRKEEEELTQQDKEAIDRDFDE